MRCEIVHTIGTHIAIAIHGKDNKENNKETATVSLGQQFLFFLSTTPRFYKNDGLLVSFLSARRSGFLQSIYFIMPSFQSRQFPPPALGGVPIEYIVQQLHALADNFWDKPDTADCTISTPSSLSPLPVILLPFSCAFPPCAGQT